MNKADSAGLIPDDVLRSIFLRLDPQSLAMCAATCRDWHRVASDSFLWQNLCQRVFYDGDACLHLYQTWKNMYLTRPRYPKFGVASDKGSMPDNRDRWVTDLTQGIFGLFHGHGDHGVCIADFVAKTLPAMLSADQLYWTDPEAAIKRAFHETELSMVSELPSLETENSGTSALVIVMRGKNLIVANVGGSKALIGREDDSGNVEGSFLCRSHVLPDREDERERILRCGGSMNENYVFATDPYYCGLVLTRTIGNSILNKSGVTSEPEVATYELTGQDRFLLLATREFFKFKPYEDANCVAKRVQKASFTLMVEDEPPELVPFSPFDPQQSSEALIAEIRDYGFFGNATASCLLFQPGPAVRRRPPPPQSSTPK